MSCKPKCIIVTGRPGSGKTTLAKKLGERLWMPVISRDEIKEGYVNTHGVKHDQLPLEANGVVSDLFFELVNQYLVGKVSIIIEAAFQHRLWEPKLPKILELGTALMVVCSVDGMVAARRHLQRGLDEPRREFYHGDKRVAVYRETGEILPPRDYESPTPNLPTIHVSTQGDYLPSVSDLVQRIQSLEIQQNGAPADSN